MELSELSSRLDDLLSENGDQGIIDVLSIIIELTLNSDRGTELRVIRASFIDAKKKHELGVITNAEFTLAANKCRNIIYPVLYSQDDQWVTPDWINNEMVINLLKLEEETEFIEVDNKDNDSLIDLNYEKDIDNEVIIPKEKIVLPDQLLGLMDGIELKRYRRSLTIAQDLVRCGDYSEAYNLCSCLMNDLEGHSIQLQELLLISLYKQFGAKEIVKDYIYGSGKYFLKIKLYSETIKSLSFEYSLKEESVKSKKENRVLKQSKSSSLLNIRFICRLLIEEVRKIYTEKTFNGKKFDYLDQYETIEIRTFYTKLIQLSMSIYSLHPMREFFGKLMVELSGGGAMNWLGVDQNFEVKDKDHLKFSPQHFRRVLCEEYAPIIFPGFRKESFFKTTAYNLLKAIRAKYVNIKKTRYGEWSIIWNANYRSLQSFIIGFSLYDDDRFLEKPLHELSGKAGLFWIDINEIGELITAKHCSNYIRNFDAVDLLKTVAKKAKNNTFDDTIANVTNNIAFKKLKSLREKYKEVPDSLTIKANKNDIKDLIKIINLCNVCYKINGDVRFLQLSMDLLSNRKKIIWINKVFISNRILFSNALFCLSLKFDALLELRRLETQLSNSNRYKPTSIETNINDVLIEPTDNDSQEVNIFEGYPIQEISISTESNTLYFDVNDELIELEKENTDDELKEETRN